MTFDFLFAVVQIPLALALTWRCAQVRNGVTGWMRDALLFVIACSACMVAWRLATLSLVSDPMYRSAGGMGIQTLFIVAFFVLVSAIGKQSDQQT